MEEGKGAAMHISRAMQQLSESETKEDILKSLHILHLLMHCDGISRAELIRHAKSKKEENPERWDAEIRQLFGKCLKSHGTAQKLHAMRNKLKYAFAEPRTLYIHTGTVLYYQHFNGPFLHSVTQVSGGGRHVLALTSRGIVFSMGDNHFGQLGHSFQMRKSPQFKPVPFSHPAAHVAAGFAFSFIVSESGEAFAWGSADDGRLGIGESTVGVEDENVYTPTKLDISEPVKMIAAGSMHAVAITTKGRTFSWGSASYNGHGWNNDCFSPTLVEALSSNIGVWASIGPGGYHTMVVDVEGKCYSWGHNRVGQVARITENVGGSIIIDRPRLVREGVATVYCGWGHSCVVDFDGRVYARGRNVCGQIGVDPKTCECNDRGHAFVDAWTHIPLPFEVKSIACGGEYTAILGDDKNVHFFGEDAFDMADHRRRVLFSSEFRGIDGDACEICAVGSMTDDVLLLST
jgi:alpha-tubulin suppressor-like RCC1 family protein